VKKEGIPYGIPYYDPAQIWRKASFLLILFSLKIESNCGLIFRKLKRC
jgi:hypothetical protein